jgi:hypothetical protein
MSLAQLVLQTLRATPRRRQPSAAQASPGRAPGIDYAGFRRVVEHMSEQRELRRLVEPEFLKAMELPGMVVLDARSRAAYDRCHVAGAVNLPLTDFTAESLAGIVRTKRTPILIYSNNNFSGDPVAFPPQAARASLSLATWATLRAYGYGNLFELAGRCDVRTTRIPLL